MNNHTLSAIAILLESESCENSDEVITGLAKIEEAVAGTITFLANPKYEKYIYTTQATAVVVDTKFVPNGEIKPKLIRVNNPYDAFTRLITFFSEKKQSKTGIEQPCFIHSEATVNETAYIGAFSYVSKGAIIGKNSIIHPQCFIGENVEIGDDCELYPGVKLLDNCKLGNNCIIHSGVVIGSDGFGFLPDNGGYKKIEQTGNVIIEDDVEIGANTTIDRASIGSTIVRKGTKIDNLVQIAHNVEVGQHTILVAQCGIAGSTKVGNQCIIGGQVGIAGHLSIANGVKIQAQSGIASSIKKEAEIVQGSPALPIYAYKKSYVHFKNLDDIEKRLRDLEKSK